jgi:hypothetical protein
MTSDPRSVRASLRFPVAADGDILDMARCEVCGNDYDKSFEVSLGGETHVFDSFECAIHALAPTCEHCACRIIGHGVEADGRIFCCANCAQQAGVTELRDRV